MYIYPVNYISITQGHHDGKSLDFGYYSHPYQDILAIGDGKVIRKETQPKGGNTIYIRHNNGDVSCYAHLHTFDIRLNQNVTRGQKIGTMGATGVVSGMHCHLGIYSKAKADIGFNKKGLYGNADIDPFKVCYVLPSQKVNPDQKDSILKQIQYYEDKKVWEPGKYRLLKSKAVRKYHKLDNNVYKVKELKAKGEDWVSTELNMLVSQRDNAEAKIKYGNILQIVEIYNENGRIWGKYGNHGSDWVVLCNIDGKPQSKKI